MPAQPRSLGGRGDIPHAPAFSPDGKILATTQFGGPAQLWDLNASKRT